MNAVMAKPKKPKAPPPAEKSKPPILFLRLEPQHEAALQAFIARQRVRTERTAVGLTALEEFFQREGLWPPKPAE